MAMEVKLLQPVKVVCTDDLGETLVDIMQTAGYSRPLMVTDSFVGSMPLVVAARTKLEQVGVDVAVFDQVKPDPLCETVESGVEAFEAHKADSIIAIGGGSSMDVARGINIVRVNGGSIIEYTDPAKPIAPCNGMIAVPTTAGTGSEVTNISIMARTRLGTKLGLVSPSMYADHAVLIPELLEGLPFSVFATSSIDALVHAVESSLSPKATPYTKLFGYKAIEMIIKGYQRIATEGREALLSLLEDFLVASNFAGIAFGTAGCAAVHALSYPLGGKYHVAHGESNYAMFTGVLKNYMELRRDGEIAVLNQYLADLLGCMTNVVYDELEKLLDQILPKRPLHEYGVTREDLPVFAHSVVTEQGRLMANNFVPLDEERVLKIYQELF